MFLASLLFSIAISYCIMENAGNFGLLIIMAISALIISGYLYITKKFFPRNIPFKLKMHFSVIIAGIIIGVITFSIIQYFQIIADLILPQ